MLNYIEFKIMSVSFKEYVSPLNFSFCCQNTFTVQTGDRALHFA